MLTRLNVETSLRDADIVIRPDVASFGLLEFDRWPRILPRGRAAVHAIESQLEAFVVPADQWQRYLMCQRRETPSLRVRDVSVDPGRGQPPALVSRLVHTGPGKPLDAAVLQADLERLYEVREFETVGFHIRPVGEEWAVSIAAHPKPWGPNFLRFGLALSSDIEGTSDFNALTNLTMTRLNRLGGEFKT